MIPTLLISLQNNCSIQPKTMAAPRIFAHLQAQAGEEMSWNTQLKPDSGCRITNEIARTAFFENCAWKKFLDSQNSSILITICLWSWEVPFVEYSEPIHYFVLIIDLIHFAKWLWNEQLVGVQNVQNYLLLIGTWSEAQPLKLIRTRFSSITILTTLNIKTSYSKGSNQVEVK